MNELVKRGGVWQYRREVPPRLRSIIGRRDVRRSLGTGDLQAALRRWRTVKAEVDRLFAEAEAAMKNPSIAACKDVEKWKQDRTAVSWSTKRKRLSTRTSRRFLRRLRDPIIARIVPS